MVNIPQIPPISQKMFYIILAIIIIVGLIFALLQFRRIRKAKKNIDSLTKETTQRKIDLVRRDLQSHGIKSDLVLPPEFPGSTTENKSTISDMGGSYNYDIREKIRDFESTTGFKKIQRSLGAIENREMQFKRKEDKFEMDEQEFKRRISKFNGDK
jgi:hypothetical protein